MTGNGSLTENLGLVVEMSRIMLATDLAYLALRDDAGGELYACKATVDMFHLTKKDFCPQVKDVISVGQFYEMAAGGQIIFT